MNPLRGKEKGRYPSPHFGRDSSVKAGNLHFQLVLSCQTVVQGPFCLSFDGCTAGSKDLPALINLAKKPPVTLPGKLPEGFHFHVRSTRKYRGEFY